MKKIRYALCALVMFLIAPFVVNAANAKIAIKTNSTAVVGNTITVTVTVSSSTPIGSIHYLINYDNSKLKLVSGATSDTWVVETAAGVKSKNFVLKFQALKSGSTSINIGSYQVVSYSDNSSMSVSTSNATINLRTQAEIEASYSKNANLKSLGVEGYSISPAFNKGTYEYTLEVENDVEHVNITGGVEDSTARVNGLGSVDLTEGANKFEIVVTAQKGNTLKYTINIERKELDPISVDIEGGNYTIVRKSDALPSMTTFTVGTTTYGDVEIPALVNDYLTLIGLKNSDGEVSVYIYENGKITKKYIELKSNLIYVNPIDLVESKGLSFLKKTNIEINGLKIDAYKVEGSDNLIIYGYNLETKEKGYYLFNTKDSTIFPLDENVTESLNGLVNNYKYVIFACLGVIVLLLILLIFKRKKKKKVIPVEEKKSETKEVEKSE